MTLPARTVPGSLGFVQFLAVGQMWEAQNVRPPADAEGFGIYVRTDRGVAVHVERKSDDERLGQLTGGPQRQTISDVHIAEPPPADEQFIFINDGAPPLGEYVIRVTNEGGGISGEISVEAAWRGGAAWPYVEGR